MKSMGREVKNLLESLNSRFEAAREKLRIREERVRAMEITKLRTRKETGLQR